MSNNSGLRLRIKSRSKDGRIKIIRDLDSQIEVSRTTDAVLTGKVLIATTKADAAAYDAEDDPLEPIHNMLAGQEADDD